MKLKANLNVAVILITVVASVGSYSVYRTWAKENPLVAEAKTFVGRKVVFPEIINLATNENYAERLAQDKTLLVYLISTCGACKKELQLIADLPAGTKVFGVMSEDRATVEKYVRQHRINFPVLIDKDAELLQQLDLKYFPANLRVENGVVKKAFFGAPQGQADMLELANAD